MKFTYENQGTATYLVYEISPNDMLDTMSLGMLTNNTIPGLAPASFTQMDTTKYIKFNVSAKVSAAQLFSGAVNKKRLIGVFTGIVDAMLAAEEYMLDADNMLLNLDYIFADVSTFETVVVCLPVMNREQKNPDLGMFFKNIVFQIEFDQTEDCSHVAKILNYLNANPVLILDDFKKLLQEISSVSYQKVPQPEAAQHKVSVSQPVATVQPVIQPAIQPTVTQSMPVQNKSVVTPGNQPSANVVSKQSAQPVNVPGNEKSNAVDVSQGEEQKSMSMFYLLQHYNKENAALYKAQKNEKKEKKAKKEVSPEKAAKGEKSKSKVNTAFAIPGQSVAATAQNAVPSSVQAPVHQTVPQVQPSKQSVIQPAPQAIAHPAMQTVQQPYVYQQQGSAINFGETTILGGGAAGETTVLTAANNPTQMIVPHLIRKKNNEKISLNKPVFRVGKERSYVDYFIGDNTAISRSHANFITRDGEYFVVDTNSTNHTFVNGTMIQSNVETMITHGDMVRLANEDFEFKLY